MKNPEDYVDYRLPDLAAAAPFSFHYREELERKPMDDFATQKVTVNKSELLAALKKNRDGHRDIFLKAQEGYRRQVIGELDKMLADAREGRKVQRMVMLEEPVEHTKDYDRVIAMLEMSTADTVSISERQFANFVMDEWAWSEQFTVTNSRYT